MSGADLVALVPAHHGTHQRQRHRHPGHARAQQLKGGSCTRQHAHPVERRAHEEQHAHPEDGRLAGDEVLEQESLVGPGQIGTLGGLVQPDRQSATADRPRTQQAQGSPEPAEPDHEGNRAHQDGFLVAVHGMVVLNEAPTAHPPPGTRQTASPRCVGQSSPAAERRLRRSSSAPWCALWCRRVHGFTFNN
jgi:hypothetical protein